MCVCVCVRVYVCVNIYMYVYIYMCMYIYTYSTFPRRSDSKWSSECKTTSKSQPGNYRSGSLFKSSNEKRPRTIVS